MTTQESVKNKIKLMLEEKLLIDFESDALDDTNLFETGYIDSYGYVELISFLESEFKIHFTDDELISGELVSFSKITAIVERKTSNG